LTTILTDTERLRKGPADLQALMASQDALSVIHGKTAGAVLAARTSGAVVLNLAAGMSPQQGATLFKQQVEEARKIAGSVRAAIPTGLGAVTMSVDGRLAMASVIVQTVGVINGRQAVETAEANLKNATEAERAEKEKALRDAKLGYMDSIGGLVAGSMDTLRVAGEAMNLQRGAAAGSMAINSIHALKFGAQVAGVFGGFLNVYVSLLKTREANAKDLRMVSNMHFVAMLSFGGTALAAGAPIAAGTLSYLAARNIGGRIVQGAATRMAAATVAGAWIPVAGWVLLERASWHRWVRRCWNPPGWKPGHGRHRLAKARRGRSSRRWRSRTRHCTKPCVWLPSPRPKRRKPHECCRQEARVGVRA